MGEVTTGLSEIRMATETFYLKQTKMNEEFEEKFGQLPAGIEAKFTELRLELVPQFASMQANSTKVREMMDALKTRRTTMATEIAPMFDKCEEKGTEMETLFDQSTEVLKTTANQVDGALKVVFEKFREHDVNFNQILTKHVLYDDLVNRRQPQGKGQSTGTTAWQEPQYGLINDKDIKMPMFPDKFENSETFRRW